MELDFVYHYEVDDKDCSGDYWDIEVFHKGELITEFGDEYHDRGMDKLEGFIEGIEWITDSDVIVNRTEVADRE